MATRKTDGRSPARSPAARSLSTEVERAAALYVRGNLADAERLCVEVLRRQPEHFDALQLMGVIAARTRRLERAIELMRKAVAINPKVASAHGKRRTFTTTAATS